MRQILLNIPAMLLLCSSIAAQTIGGASPQDGNFILEDAEDGDLVAGGVMRDWITSYISPSEGGLEAVPLSGSGLTLAAGQSSGGSLRFTMPSSFQFITHNMGVPVPGQPGESTLTSPGDISGFEKLTFLTRHSEAFSDQSFSVILECYPEVSPGTFPKLHWEFAAPVGTAFEPVEINLAEPTFTENTGGRTVEELLSQTRFISFFYFVQLPDLVPATLEIHIDDIRLIPPDSPAPETVAIWILS